VAASGADLGFYKGRCPIHLKGAPEVERRKRQGEVWGGGCALSPEFFLYFLYQNGEFYAFLEIFIDTVTASKAPS